MTDIHGSCDERFARVRDVFEENFTERDDVGASVAVSVEGEFVVDLWGGHRDAAGTLPWERDTIVNVYSTTKTMTALCTLVLADRGELDFDAPVARYWPEFAQNGKQHVKVAHLLAHTAGLSGMDQPMEGDALYDWDGVCSALAAQAPWWEPGTASGYHAVTQGYLIGEVVRRISGKSLGTFFSEEIAGPLDADFHIGTPETEWPRVGELIPPDGARAASPNPDPEAISSRTFRNPPVDARASRTPGWRAAEIPAANGHGNARSVVRAQTPLANGGSAFGVDLLSASGAARVLEEQSFGEDLVLGVPIRFGLGYGLNGGQVPMGPNENTCYWGGWGGSTIVVDQDAHLCCSYVMNKMDPGVLGDVRGYLLLQAAYEGLG